MLARNFMSAADLGISAEHRATLIALLGRFERGKIKPEKFCMTSWCGTACCIWGQAKLISETFIDLETIRHGGAPKQLHGLFLPSRSDDSLSVYPRGTDLARITVEQAGRALANYLTTGRSNWYNVLREENV